MVRCACLSQNHRVTLETRNERQFDLALTRVARAFEQRTLTKALFVTAYSEAREALGDGIEAEAIEAITKYADGPAWVSEAEDVWLRRGVGSHRR